LVLDNIDGSSSLAASISMVVEQLESRIDAVATNEVRWGTRSTLVAALSHFLELKSELELLSSKRNVDLTEDQVDALCDKVRVVSDSLASHIPPSVTHSPPYSVGE
jgi:hypothetical protein